MAELFTPLTLTQINNQVSSAVTQINTNFQTIAALFQDVVSLSGVTPNTMLTQLNMNGYHVNNVPAATQTGQPVTYEQFTAFTTGTSFPAASMSGTLLPANFPTLAGDVTTPGGSLTTTVAKLQGTTFTGTTGNGAVVLGTAPTVTNATLVTPTLGTATATTINNVAFTNPGSLSTIVTTAGATVTLQGTDTYVGRATTDILTNKSIVTTAGTATQAPLILTAGTVLTSPAAGAEEYDGVAFYKTSTAGNRGVLRAEQFQRLVNNYVLGNVATVQPAFNSTANGAITLVSNTTYSFEMQLIIQNTGTTSHTWSVLFGGTATLTSGNMIVQAISSTSSAMAAVSQGYTTGLTTAYVATAASTSATESVTIRCTGVVSINAGGTFIPQLQLSAATGVAASVLANSYIKLNVLGNGSVASVGNWS